MTKDGPLHSQERMDSLKDNLLELLGEKGKVNVTKV